MAVDFNRVCNYLAASSIRAGLIRGFSGHRGGDDGFGDGENGHQDPHDHDHSGSPRAIGGGGGGGDRGSGASTNEQLW